MSLHSGAVTVGLNIRKMCDKCRTPRAQLGGKFIWSPVTLTRVWRCAECVNLAEKSVKTPHKPP